MLRRALLDVGLSEKEIAVYLTALELGPQPVSVIARKSSLNRSTAYVVLNELMNRGLVSKFTKADVQHFAASKPEVLLDYLDRKKSDIERQARSIKDLLPELKSLTIPYSSKPRVRYFEGEEGVKQVMEDTFNSQEELLNYASLHKWLVGPLKDFITEYGTKRVNKYKISLKSLINDSKLTRDYLKTYPAKLTKYRWISSDIEIIDNEINIYDDKVSIVSLVPDNMFGVIIENQEIADTQKAIFKLAWRGADGD